jgi:hypothetical protein
MPQLDKGWSWLEPPQAKGDEARRQLARAFARVFSGPDGEAVLAHLRSLTIERCLGPDASDSLLRCLEGQRQLVHHILALAARGREGG